MLKRYNSTFTYEYEIIQKIIPPVTVSNRGTVVARFSNNNIRIWKKNSPGENTIEEIIM